MLEEQTVELDTELEQDQDQTDEVETESTESEDSDQEENSEDSIKDKDEDEEVVVSIGEEASPSQEKEELREAPKWVKEVRKDNRNLKKQIRELEKKESDRLALLSVSDNNPDNPGKRPKLEDFDFDSDKYEENLENWFEKKQKSDEHMHKVKEEETKHQKAWNDQLESFNEEKKKIKVKDYDEAEFNSQELLSNTQQGLIIQGADNPALVIYALGKNPKKLKEISQIKDPVKFSFAVSKMETQLKVTSRKRATSNPERIVTGSTSTDTASVSEKTLDRLREEAAKSGDMSKLIAYKKKLKK